MKLELATWPDGTTAKEIEEEPDALEIDSEFVRLDGLVRGDLSVQKNDDEFVIEGRLKVKVTATCVRCLGEFPIPVDERFRRIVNIVPDKEVQEDSGDPDYVFIPRSLPEWDLAGMFRELVLLAVPDNPLCRDDCAGLCPKCGKNRNNETCDCHTEDTGGPFSKLTELLDKDKDQDKKNSETTSGD